MLCFRAGGCGCLARLCGAWYFTKKMQEPLAIRNLKSLMLVRAVWLPAVPSALPHTPEELHNSLHSTKPFNVGPRKKPGAFGVHPPSKVPPPPRSLHSRAVVINLELKIGRLLQLSTIGSTDLLFEALDRTGICIP